MFLFHRNPDAALIVGVFLVAVAGIPFEIVTAANLVVRVVRQPLLENLRIQRLKRVWHWSRAFEFRPLSSGKLDELHTGRNVAARVFAGDEIAELSAPEIVNAHAVFAYAVVDYRVLLGARRRFARVDRVIAVFFAYFVPELRDLFVRFLV